MNSLRHAPTSATRVLWVAVAEARGHLIDEAAQRAAEWAAGRPLHFVLSPADTGYYEAKNRGFAATSAEIVVFADSDCWPAPSWLEHLLSPFREPVLVAAGRATYRDDLLGSAASAIDFMYFPSLGVHDGALCGQKLSYHGEPPVSAAA